MTPRARIERYWDLSNRRRPLAVQAFREHQCAPTPMAAFEVEARSPAVTHTVSLRKVEDWLRSSAKSPADRIMKEKLKGMMAS